MDILIVEDNTELAGLLQGFLSAEGYTAAAASTGGQALELFEKYNPRLVILDIMLPGIDGFAFCAAVRKKSNVPVLIMSARADKEDKMNGFALGADDYMEKSVDMDILLAKINALMRRNYDLKRENVLLVSGSLSIDKEAKRVYLHEKEVVVTGKEYELLLVLVENPGRTLNKEYLFDRIWGADSFSESQTLTVHIKMLRDKIEDNPAKPERIKTVWGVGYRYEEN